MNKQASKPIHSNEYVILLHGLARTSRSMAKLEATLQSRGYKTLNYNYPSSKYDIEKLAEDVISDALSKCIGAHQIHFVTHSMGGILVRQYLSANKIENLGFVVMLGPPNKGSQVVDRLKNLPGFQLLNGPSGMQLGTSDVSIPNRLGAANFKVGIIAGTRSMNLILSTLLPDINDGKVTVENTKLEGMSDHIALPVMHPFMMNNKVVINQVLYYLEHGVFKR